MYFINNLFCLDNINNNNDNSNNQDDLNTDIRVLIVSSYLNSRDLYTKHLPFLYLKSIGVIDFQYCSLPNKYNKDYIFNEIIQELSEDQIQWATHIVFPFNLDNLSSTFEEIRNINEHIFICYYFDYNVFLLPDYHSHINVINEELKRNLIENILYSDIIFFSNQFLLEFIKINVIDQLEENQDCISLRYINQVCYDKKLLLANFNNNIKDNNDRDFIKDESKFRILILSNGFNDQDILSVKDVLIDILARNQNIELYILGNINKSLFTDLTFKHIKKTSLTHFYKMLWHINHDVLLIPLIDNDFNKTTEDIRKVIDMSVLNIPCICKNITPYTEHIKNNKNGILFKDNQELSSILNNIDVDLYKKIGLSASRRFTNIKYSNAINMFLDI